MRGKRFRVQLLMLTLTLVFSIRAPESALRSDINASLAAVYLRANQVGYLPAEAKLALAMTDDNLSGQTFTVVTDPNGSVVFTGNVDTDRGAYGNFAHLYELNFSSLNARGVYRLRLDGATSLPFAVGSDVYAGILSTTLQFFRVQRCGDTVPLLHGACHLTDGVAAGGQANGATVDASGGWHDAGDYLKFLITTGTATNLMLTAYQRHPERFADADHNAVPEVLDEARIGLDWMHKLWDPAQNVLYYQAGDASDHGTWRMPEGDDTNRPIRPVWACEPGKGANVAGTAAAALALAAFLWNDPARPFYNPTLATAYQTAAQQIYDYGKARPAAQSSTAGFYNETSWQDDLALAAAELYRATGNATYLSEARSYATAAGAADPYGRAYYSDLHALAHYEIARLDPTYRDTAVAWLADDLVAFQTFADANPFRAAVDQFYWGSAGTMMGAALEAVWYEDLSGQSTYRALAQSQRDYMLGKNPWGISFVNSVGDAWPRHPHHQVADLTQSELVGFWNEGPVSRSGWQAIGITLHDPDIYTVFQSDAAVYHDDVEDYATNEPTLMANALGLALSAWYAPTATDVTTPRMYLPMVVQQPAPAAGDLIIYGDALADGWEDWSWDSMVDLTNTQPVHGGSRSIAITYTQAHGGLSLRSPNSIATGAYEALTFWVFGSGMGNSLYVYIQQTDDGNPSGGAFVETMPGVWMQATISLSEFGNPAVIRRVTVLEDAGAPQPTLYVDDVRLVAAGGQSTPTPTATPDGEPTHTPTPTATAEATAIPDDTADRVLGQPNLTSNTGNNGGISVSTLRKPSGVAVAPNGRIFVADYENNRVLSWPSATDFTNGQAADLVIGQANFTGSAYNQNLAPAANTLAGPESVVVDGNGNLYVADTENHRVLQYTPPFATNMNASRVFGQPNFNTVTPNTGGITASSVNFVRGIAVDGNNNLYVADEFNHRVLVFQNPLTTDAAADVVIGQADFTYGDADGGGNGVSGSGLHTPLGIAVDGGGNLYVADYENNRVVVFTAPLTSGKAASHVFGQPDFTSNTANNGGLSASSLYAPHDLAVDTAGHLFVSDAFNNRVLVYLNPLTGDAVADAVYGQDGSFTDNTENSGSIGPRSLYKPMGLAFDGEGDLYLADFENSRVLAFDAAP